MRMILIPGNGGGGPEDNWFPWLAEQAEGLGLEVINVEFPDNQLARAEYWLPFLEKESSSHAYGAKSPSGHATAL